MYTSFKLSTRQQPLPSPSPTPSTADNHETSSKAQRETSVDAALRAKLKPELHQIIEVLEQTALQQEEDYVKAHILFDEDFPGHDFDSVLLPHARRSATSNAFERTRAKRRAIEESDWHLNAAGLHQEFGSYPFTSYRFIELLAELSRTVPFRVARQRLIRARDLRRTGPSRRGVNSAPDWTPGDVQSVLEQMPTTTTAHSKYRRKRPLVEVTNEFTRGLENVTVKRRSMSLPATKRLKTTQPDLVRPSTHIDRDLARACSEEETHAEEDDNYIISNSCLGADNDGDSDESDEIEGGRNAPSALDDNRRISCYGEDLDLASSFSLHADGKDGIEAICQEAFPPVECDGSNLGNTRHVQDALLTISKDFDSLTCPAFTTKPAPIEDLSNHSSALSNAHEEQPEYEVDAEIIEDSPSPSSGLYVASEKRLHHDGDAVKREDACGHSPTLFDAQEKQLDHDISAMRNAPSASPGCEYHPIVLDCDNSDIDTPNSPITQICDKDAVSSSLQAGVSLSDLPIRFVSETFRNISCFVADPALISTTYPLSALMSRRPLQLASEVKVILVPLHQRNHWTVAVVNLSDGSIQYFDSLRSNSHTEEARECMLTFGVYLTYYNPSLRNVKWSFKVEACEQQSNEHDCGIYVIVRILYHLAGAGTTMPPIDTELWRSLLRDAIHGRLGELNNDTQSGSTDASLCPQKSPDSLTDQIVTFYKLMQTASARVLAAKSAAEIFNTFSILHRRIGSDIGQRHAEKLNEVSAHEGMMKICTASIVEDQAKIVDVLEVAAAKVTKQARQFGRQQELLKCRESNVHAALESAKNHEQKWAKTLVDLEKEVEALKDQLSRAEEECKRQRAKEQAMRKERIRFASTAAGALAGTLTGAGASFTADDTER